MHSFIGLSCRTEFQAGVWTAGGTKCADQSLHNKRNSTLPKAKPARFRLVVNGHPSLLRGVTVNLERMMLQRPSWFPVFTGSRVLATCARRGMRCHGNIVFWKG